MRMMRECGVGSALLWSIGSWTPVLQVYSFPSFIGIGGLLFFVFLLSRPGVIWFCYGFFFFCCLLLCHFLRLSFLFPPFMWVFTFSRIMSFLRKAWAWVICLLLWEADTFILLSTCSAMHMNMTSIMVMIYIARSNPAIICCCSLKNIFKIPGLWYKYWIIHDQLAI